MSDWQRVRSIVEGALELKGPERERFVAERCREDLELRAEVLSYLAADAAPDTYLDTPPDSAALRTALARADPELAEGTRLGPWVVRRKLASGGMGTVYLAERADGSFEKTVAIKLIKAGMDSAEVLARFENERRVLAELEHPGIARLLDAGATDGGRPYLLMEFVGGTPIDVHARDAGLDLRARIELFASVCDAVQAAHRLLVVHRDLKPDNILVTPEGTPKLLDFGISKVLHSNAHSADGRAATLGPSRVMTPEYASPEQVRGERIDTASDVYSLGVVLYELLAGRRPLDFAGQAEAEVAHIASVRDPVPPSVVADADWARKVGTSVRGWKMRLAGDLDTITLKALHKEPGRRYASAGLFAEDLRRYLAGEPVLARPDTWTYRASRLVRRHRPAVIGGTAVALALAAGLSARSSERQRTTQATELADERFDDVHELARRFLFEFDSMLENVEGATPARESAVKTGLEYLDVLAQQASSDVSLTREVALAYVKMGDLQGGALVSNLGQRAEAMESYRRALALAEQLPTNDPESGGVLALCLHRIGALEESMGSLEAALENYRRAVEIGAIQSDRVSSIELLEALAQVEDSLVEHSLRTGNHEAALRHAEEFVRLADKLSSSVADDFQVWRQTLALARLGNTLALLGRHGEAEPKLRGAVDCARRWASEQPNGALAGRQLAFCLTGLVSYLQSRGQLEESAPLIEESTTILRGLYTRDPRNAQAARDLGVSLNLAANIYSSLGEPERSLEIGLEYCALTQHLIELDPENFRYMGDLVGARLAVCRSRSLLGQFDLALEAGLAAERELQGLSALQPTDLQTTRNQAVVASELGMLRRNWSRKLDQPSRQLQQLELARSAFARGLEVLTGLRDEGRLAPSDVRYIERARSDVADCTASIEALRTDEAASIR